MPGEAKEYGLVDEVLERLSMAFRQTGLVVPGAIFINL